MRIATQIRYCSSCHNQNVDLIHVDFDAYWDGPVIDTPELKVAIDDLILCSECLGAAATLIGYVHDADMKRENQELGEAVEATKAEMRDKDNLLDDLRKALNDAMKGRQVNQRVLDEAREMVAV